MPWSPWRIFGPLLRPPPEIHPLPASPHATSPHPTTSTLSGTGHWLTWVLSVSSSLCFTHTHAHTHTHTHTHPSAGDPLSRRPASSDISSDLTPPGEQPGISEKPVSCHKQGHPASETRLFPELPGAGGPLRSWQLLSRQELGSKGSKVGICEQGGWAQRIGSRAKSWRDKEDGAQRWGQG